MQNNKMDTSDLNQSHQQPIQLIRQQSKQEIQQNNEIEKKNLIFQQNIRDAQKTHGVVEICFVLDCTQSMDPHIKNAIQCIEMAIKQIKEQTNRECRWAAVAYKDEDYLQVTKQQQYPQIDFVDNHLKVMEFIRSQKCAGGADTAEDLQLGFRQAANLKWENNYRIIMLVTDAPCHGKKYSNNISDNLPDRTIEAELDLLLKQKIYLICLNLPPQPKGMVHTEKMFTYFKQYYNQKGFENQINVVECQKMIQGDLQLAFTQSLSLATLTITSVFDPNTQINPQTNRQIQQIRSQLLGAAEALYKKLPDPTNFDKFNAITVKGCRFIVHRCEFKSAVLQSNIHQIWNVGNTLNDYEYVKQNNPWECIRTETHFAEGQMKKVYLMKKIDRPQEVYVIKAPITGLPYQSFQEACKECRSHLVAKIFMKKFRDLCFEQKQEKNIQLEIPPIQYSDFLILEEEGKSAWWIAERFFKGDFVKYNNNNGYIRDTQDLFNQFSQAFTIFTYFQSDGTMMICDVQGMGQYFTDPAINTKKGGFDDTDIGLNGIKNYLVNFIGKCLGKEYLELLNIKINT